MVLCDTAELLFPEVTTAAQAKTGLGPNSNTREAEIPLAENMRNLG